MEAIRIIRTLRPRSALQELRYWYVERPVARFRPWLATKYPAWLVRDALVRATVMMIDDDEVVPEVPAVTVLDRWGKGTRPRKRVRR